MPSPFPGMDPYVEARWLDFHAAMIVRVRSAIQRQLGDDLVAGVEERVVVEAPDSGAAWRRGSAVRIVEMGPVATWSSPRAVAVAEPIRIEATERLPIEQRFIEIRDLSTGGKVITVIELVSPTNKLPGDGRVKYEAKQQECLDAKVNLVEIDLNRTGRRNLISTRYPGSNKYDESTYQVSVWRAAKPNGVDLYPISIRQMLPTIRIPLRATDDDAKLDLQAIFNECYADARYDRTARYERPCDPPLERPDDAWADQLLKAAGKR